VRRVVLTALATAGVLAATAAPAYAHAVLLTSSPQDRGEIAAPPGRVTLRFSEAVDLLRPSDAVVVDERDNVVSVGGGRTSPRDASVVEIELPAVLPPASYTVRYRIVSADSHVIDGDTTFATGGAALKDPVLGDLEAGPGEASAYAVAARFLEVVGLGGALALVVFQWLVWAPAARRTHAGPDVAAWGRERFWRGWWTLIAITLLGELAVLVTKAATSLGKSVPAAAADPNGVYRVFSETRFGEHYQLRLGLILVLIAVALWDYLGEPETTRPTGRAWPAAAMAGLAAACLVLISSQGHASQAPGGELSVADDAVHLLSICVWVGGLAALAYVLARLPRDTALGAAVLARFSRVALVAVGVAVLTGTLRAIAELDDPSQLWDTAYGRSIVIKVALLCPLAALAFSNRRVLVAIDLRGRANRATLRLVARNAQAELALSLAIVVVASLLVAQVPGRT
jgi:copper transport protein